MTLRTFACRSGAHDHCPAIGDLCNCPCHHPDELEEPTPMTTDPIAASCELIRTRIDQIDEELSRYDDLRAERKRLDTALRGLTGKKSTAKRAPAGDATSLKERVCALIAGEPDSDWPIPEINDALGGAEDGAQIWTACSQLAAAERIQRVGRGIYKAVA